MAKKYDIPDEKPNMVSEAAVAYANTITPQAMVESNSMPCTYTDEEFRKELVLSEASGFISNEDFKRSCLEKWGVAL